MRTNVESDAVMEEPVVVKRRCTKKNPCVLSEIKKDEYWEHEDTYEVIPDDEISLLIAPIVLKCPNCGLEFKWKPD